MKFKSLSAAMTLMLLAARATASDWIYVPVEKSLWKVSSSGTAERQAFTFHEASVMSNFPRVSPDAQWIAFSRAGNIWMLNPNVGHCVQVTGFADWDINSSWAQSPLIYGWTPDGSRIVFRMHSAEYGPGEGEPPPTIPPLDGCTKVSKRKANSDKSSLRSVPDGQYQISIASFSLQKFEGASARPPTPLYADGSYGGTAKSPKGKHEAFINDPFLGKAELVVDGKVAIPGTKIRHFWWISDTAIASLGFDGASNSWALNVTTIPEFKTFGPFLEKRR